MVIIEVSSSWDGSRGCHGAYDNTKEAASCPHRQPPLSSMDGCADLSAWMGHQLSPDNSRTGVDCVSNRNTTHRNVVQSLRPKPKPCLLSRLRDGPGEDLKHNPHLGKEIEVGIPLLKWGVLPVTRIAKQHLV